jgi:hypothetical protein
MLFQTPAITKGFAASYSIKGTLSYEGHGLGEPVGQKKKPFEREVEVSVDDCNWSIKTILVGNTNYSYFLTTYDGTNITYVDKLTAETFSRLVDSQKLRSPQRGSRTNLFGTLVVESSPVPRIRSSIADAYVWLAFSSGCYFKGLTNNFALDLYALDPYGDGFMSARREISCRFELSSAPPYLPIKLEYMWNSFSRTMPDGKTMQAQLPTPFKDGFLAGQLISGEFTNINGLSFPTKFEMKEYRPLPRVTNESDFRCTLVVRGVVTSISAFQQELPNELSGRKFYVADLRWPEVPMYFASNGVIPSLDDPGLAVSKREALIAAKRRVGDNTETMRRGRIWLFILLTMVIVPLFFFFRRGRK